MKTIQATERGTISLVIFYYSKVFVEYISEGNVELYANPDFKVFLRNNGSEIASETIFREADTTLEKYPSKPYYTYYGPIFKRIGNFVYFLSGMTVVKSVDLTNPSSGFVTCVKDVRAFDVDFSGIICVDGARKKLSHYSSQTSKSKLYLPDTESSLLCQTEIASNGKVDITQILAHRNGVFVAGTDEIDSSFRRVLILYDKKGLKEVDKVVEDTCKFLLPSCSNYPAESNYQL